MRIAARAARGLSSVNRVTWVNVSRPRVSNTDATFYMNVHGVMMRVRYADSVSSSIIATHRGERSKVRVNYLDT